MNPIELESMNKVLILSGHKNLVPIKGIMKWSQDDKQPVYYYLTCAKSNGGLVRVEITLQKYPIEDMKIEIIKSITAFALNNMI